MVLKCMLRLLVYFAVFDVVVVCSLCLLFIDLLRQVPLSVYCYGMLSWCCLFAVCLFAVRFLSLCPLGGAVWSLSPLHWCLFAVCRLVSVLLLVSVCLSICMYLQIYVLEHMLLSQKLMLLNCKVHLAEVWKHSVLNFNRFLKISKNWKN